MTKKLVHFLLVYSCDEGRLIHQDQFKDPKAATQAYEDAEQHYRNLEKFEVVLLGADSIETVMQTHGHYFTQSLDSLFSDFLTTADS